jgi:uncharacterized protein
MTTFIITIIAILAAQTYLRITYARWAKQPNKANITGKQAAEAIIRKNNLTTTIQQTPGNLTDHYDPRTNTIHLSEHTHNKTSIAAIAVAAHEAGHALQHATQYKPLQLRMKTIPLANIGERFGPILIILGFILGNFGQPLMIIGLLTFTAAVAYHIITLPTEYDASHRAKTQLQQLGLITPTDTQGITTTLNAAALTYVAATATSVLYLLHYLQLFLTNRD